MNRERSSFPRVFVVVLNYNHWEDTVACVESLLRLEPPAVQVVVVDNASTDGSMEHLRGWAKGEFVPALCAVDPTLSAVPVPKPVAMMEYAASSPAETRPDGNPPAVVLINCGTNRGYAAGNNVGIRHALAQGADAVWVLNNDTVVRPDALGAMVARLFSKKRPGLCGSVVRYFHDPETVQCRGGGFTSSLTLLSRLDGQGLPVAEALSESPEAVEERLNFVYGASVMVSREFVRSVGFMNEGYFLYCEEQDWAFSAGGRFDLAYAPKSHVFHKEGSTTGWPAARFHPRILFWLVRSRLRLAVRHCPAALPVVAASLAFAMLRLAWQHLSRSR
jgi:GT2 family glycosyltransferase